MPDKQSRLMKLFQYDKKIWDTGNEVSHTWQFGVISNTTLLGVFFETPGSQYSACGGITIVLTLFSSSFISVNFNQRKFGLAFHILTKYFKGWED